MKIRHGFVSNSSTTSFCIYGICVESGEEVESLAEKLEIFNKHNYDGDYLYIGREWKNIKDNETGAQFKKKHSGKDRKICSD